MAIFFWLILLLPVIEIALFIQVGGAIGVWNTILLCILAGIFGSILIRYQGVSTLLAMQAVSRRGQVPLQQMFDGFCLALAGLLLVLPGFFTDILAFALMVPMLRGILREQLLKRSGFREMTPAEEDVIDAEFHRVEIERIERE
jgi:UPF0716 protein FxsA